MSLPNTPPLAGITEQLFAICARNPGKTAALVDGRAHSYAELKQRICACMQVLHDSGAVPGDTVLIAYGNGLDFIASFFGSLGLGLTAVPVNPAFKADELRHCIRSCQPHAVFCAASVVPLLDEALPTGASIWTDTGALATARPTARPWTAASNKAGVHMFSSGSTGQSKRITRSAYQLLAEYEALASRLGLNAEDRILCTVPLYHAHGMGNALIAALLSGATLVLLTQEFNGRQTLNTLIEQNITLYPSVPFMLRILAATRSEPRPQLDALRHVISAGAPLPPATHARFHDRYGVSVSQLFGSTETGALTINIDSRLNKPGSVGRALPGVRVQVRGEDGAPAPANEEGEIWVSSPSMCLAYDELAEQTAQAFRDDFFCTGDLGYLDQEGDLTITGRKKLMINVAGIKVDPVEVERVLDRHPDIAESVVLGIPHPMYGELIKAVVVAKGAASGLDTKTVLDYAKAHLSEHKRPKQVEFRPQIPRSALGKVLRKYLV